jgi:hypothetical protein
MRSDLCFHIHYSKSLVYSMCLFRVLEVNALNTFNHAFLLKSFLPVLSMFGGLSGV